MPLELRAFFYRDHVPQFPHYLQAGKRLELARAGSENPGLDPSTHKVAYNSLNSTPEDSMPSSGLLPVTSVVCA